MEKRIIKNVVGLDLSLTSTGLVVTAPGELEWASFNFKSDPSSMIWNRLGKITREILKKVGEQDLVVVENYAFSNRATLASLAELGGLVKFALHGRTGFWPIIVAPTTLKKFAASKGNVGKDEIKLAVYKKDKVEFKTTDETDAWVLAQIGLCLAGAKPTYRPKWHGYELEAISTVIKTMANEGRGHELQALALS